MPPPARSHQPDPEAFDCDAQPERDAVRVRTTGSLDLASAPQLDAELNRLCEVGFRRLIVDLSNLRFMDSTGLRLLLRWDATARQDGLSIELIPGPPAVQRVFDLTGTAKLLPFRTADTPMG